VAVSHVAHGHRRSRPLLILLGATLLLVAGTAERGHPGAGSPGSPTPVVLVSVDTLRADRLNLYGYEARLTSPHLDALARDAVVFENHVAAAPWTPPSQMSLLTGLWPSSHGVTYSFKEFHEGERGESRIPVLGPSRRTLAQRLSEKGYATAAFTGGRTLSGWLGFDRGFSTFHTNMFKVSAPAMDEMLGWVGRNQDRRFFLFWHTFETHAPYLGTRFLEEVLPPAKAQKVRALVEEMARAKSTQEAPLRNRLRALGAYRREVTEALYAGAIVDADRWVGRLLDELKARRLYDRCLLIVTSDHGEEFADRSPQSYYNAHGHDVHREMVHVPLLVKLPGQAHAGQRVSAVSRAVDVVPTVLDVLGLPHTAPGLQGESLVPLWEGGEKTSRPAFVEALEFEEEKKSIRTDEWKLIVTVDAESVARRGRSHLPAQFARASLFDLRKDPLEREDLLAPASGSPAGVAPRHAAVAAALEADLRAHLRKQRAEPATAVPPPEAIEALRALGYVN
jgi:arylsulfatase A-like enzyme